ncbi:MAG: hypothetical protein H6Q48_40 [Deltaproteobacteria bacterium]|nr:hypothetical protein [Deltaproteobacteria bacterium]
MKSLRVVSMGCSERQCVGRMTYTDLYRKMLRFNRVLRILLCFSK